ncbi:hypothetical protein HAX54_029634, partial [Datura stramonium]|nr:hypothetical protein [Datura stramonium]
VASYSFQGYDPGSYCHTPRVDIVKVDIQHYRDLRIFDTIPLFGKTLVGIMENTSRQGERREIKEETLEADDDVDLKRSQARS